MFHTLNTLAHISLEQHSHMRVTSTDGIPGGEYIHTVPEGC
jgi:hypothetical protein